MTRFGVLSGLAGLALALALIIGQGAGDVLAQLSVAGWGLAAVAFARFVPLVLSAVGWRVLLPGRRKHTVAWYTWIVWVREAVNALLPVLRIGGEVVSVRLMMRGGISAAQSVASLVVDITLSLFILLGFVASGALLLARRGGGESLVGELALGLVVSAVIVAVFFVVQRMGMFALSSRLLAIFGDSRWTELAGGAVRLDRAVRRLWRLRRRILSSFLWQSVSWLAGVGEMWLTVAVLGQTIGFAEAFILEALILGMGQAAFMVPGALGVQEGGFLVIGAALGLPPDLALAAALVRRARDILVYSPALAVWSGLEGGRLADRFRPRLLRR